MVICTSIDFVITILTLLLQDPLLLVLFKLRFEFLAQECIDLALQSLSILLMLVYIRLGEDRLRFPPTVHYGSQYVLFIRDFRSKLLSNPFLGQDGGSCSFIVLFIHRAFKVFGVKICIIKLDLFEHELVMQTSLCKLLQLFNLLIVSSVHRRFVLSHHLIPCCS